MWNLKVGLEIHLRVNTEFKIFCHCKNTYSLIPNTDVCPICTGQPGSLPYFNEEVIEKIVFASNIFNMETEDRIIFDRKHYFYNDLPKNFQISQFYHPFAYNGKYNYLLPNKSIKEVRMKEIHLEEDAGKSIHTAEYWLLDFNRAGVPLIEMVTHPDFSSPEEVKYFLRSVQRVMKYSGISNANMESGDMRVDVNVSIFNDKKGLIGERVEIKNMNSFSNVEKAIKYEVERQKSIMDNKDRVKRETRGWDENKDVTYSMRSKEEVMDYLYLREPNIPEIGPVKKNSFSSFATFSSPESKRIELSESGFALDYYEISCLVENDLKLNIFKLILASHDKSEAKKAFDFIQNILFREDINEEILLSILSKTPKNLNNLYDAYRDKRINKFELIEIIKKKEFDFAMKMIDTAEKVSDNEIVTIIREELDKNSEIINDSIEKQNSSVMNKLIGNIRTRNPKIPLSNISRQIQLLSNLKIMYHINCGGTITARNLNGEYVLDTDTIAIEMKKHCRKNRWIYINNYSKTIFSEDADYDFWNGLLHEIHKCLNSNLEYNILITHGVDTISIIGSILFWLFNGIDKSLILAAATMPRKAEDLVYDVNKYSNSKGYTLLIDSVRVNPISTGIKADNESNLKYETTKSYEGLALRYNRKFNFEKAKKGMQNVEIIMVYPGLTTARIHEYIFKNNIKYIVFILYRNITCSKDVLELILKLQNEDRIVFVMPNYYDFPADKSYESNNLLSIYNTIVVEKFDVSALLGLLYSYFLLDIDEDDFNFKEFIMGII